MKKLTRRELRQIINESINEGFFGNVMQGLTDTFGQKYNIEFSMTSNLRGHMSEFQPDVFSAAYMVVKNHFFEFTSALREVTGLSLPARGSSVKEKTSMDDQGFVVELNNTGAKDFITNNPKYIRGIKAAFDAGDYGSQQDGGAPGQMINVGRSRDRIHRPTKGKMNLRSLNLYQVFRKMINIEIPQGGIANADGLEAMSYYFEQLKRKRLGGLAREEEIHGGRDLAGVDISRMTGDSYSKDMFQIRETLRSVSLSLSYGLVALADSMPVQ